MELFVVISTATVIITEMGVATDFCYCVFPFVFLFRSKQNVHGENDGWTDRTDLAAKRGTVKNGDRQNMEGYDKCSVLLLLCTLYLAVLRTYCDGFGTFTFFSLYVCSLFFPFYHLRTNFFFGEGVWREGGGGGGIPSMVVLYSILQYSSSGQ